MASLAWGWVLWAASSAQAQQTIFNVPSVEITPEKEVFLEAETQFRAWKPGRFMNNTEYGAVGVGHHTELAVTLFNLNAPSTHNLAVGVGMKSSLPILTRRLPRQEMKVTLGEMVPISLTNEGVGNWSYGILSTRVPKLKTRLAAGVNVGTRQIFGRNVVCAIASYEQPITSRLMLQGDWYSGTHALGFFISGFSYTLPKKVMLFMGYQIPNNPRVGRQGFVIELSRLF